MRSRIHRADAIMAALFQSTDNWVCNFSNWPIDSFVIHLIFNHFNLLLRWKLCYWRVILLWVTETTNEMLEALFNNIGFRFPITDKKPRFPAASRYVTDNIIFKDYAVLTQCRYLIFRFFLIIYRNIVIVP